MKINPRYSGGGEAFREVTPTCTLAVHKPVFNGLFGERKTGFVQVDWRGKMPQILSDTIDFNRDKIPDFSITIDTRNGTTKLNSIDQKVTGLGVSTATSFGWAVRVNLTKTE